ncbi:oxidation resistance protein 1-like [Gossypium australe]|uniref:Oxidation resistance protein 1-like n=1 Tax=Gossypium australe TaxID=47621 RepID=A0A5B6UB86_9ROSI|nr:oxidation resistance protein 1-like [Gossypium australe]
MYTLKDKVAEGLSRLFSDSSNHSTPSDLSQASLYSKGSSSLYSIFSYITPSVSSGGSKSKDHGSHLKPIESLPIRWKYRALELQDEPLDSYEDLTIPFTNEKLLRVHEVKKKISEDSDNKQTISPRGEDKDCTSERRSSDSYEFQDTREQRSSIKPPLNLSDKSVFITCDLYEFLVSSLPNIVKGCQWMLLYSTLKHGISLRTLIRKSAELPGPCLLITGDRKGAVFGAMLECPLKPTPKRKYQGTNQTFVFTTVYGEPRLFRPTGANRYYYICLNDLLAVGGGGNFALCLDGELLTGSSGPSETFGNFCLAHNQDFDLNNVETRNSSSSFPLSPYFSLLYTKKRKTHGFEFHPSQIRVRNLTNKLEASFTSPGMCFCFGDKAHELGTRYGVSDMHHHMPQLKATEKKSSERNTYSSNFMKF